MNGSLMHYDSCPVAAYLHQNRIKFARSPAFLCWLSFEDTGSKLNFEGIWLSCWFCMSHPGFFAFSTFSTRKFSKWFEKHCCLNVSHTMPLLLASANMVSSFGWGASTFCYESFGWLLIGSFRSQKNALHVAMLSPHWGLVLPFMW